MRDKLKKYVCKHPFEYMDLQPYQVYVCCPSWCSKSIRDNKTEISWTTDSAIDIRKSVLDGSYKYCNDKVCPPLNLLLNSEEVPSIFVDVEEFKEKHNIETLDDVKNIKTTPKNVNFGFDRSCNFKCPSCRSKLVPNDDESSNEYKEKLETLRQIEDNFSEGIETITITGSGDPFYSKIFRNYLIDFDEKKYPNLQNINVITNGRLLNEKMWNSLSAKKFIKKLEISIDAGTKYTYENITRIGGDWDILINNLKFISTIKTIEKFTTSFVVSELNYLEMEIFYNLINDIFKNSHITPTIFFTQHIHWGDGAYTPKQVENIAVFNRNHIFFDSFIEQLNKIHGKHNVQHNFHHLISVI